MKEQFVYGRNPVLELLKSEANIDRLFVLHGETSGSIRKIVGMAKDRGIEIKQSDKKKLDELSQMGNHQGVAALINGFRYADLSEVLEKWQAEGKKGFVLLLDGIEDPHNLGAILRTAECSGADLVVIPKRRSAQVNETVYKVSAGAAEYVEVARVSNLVNAMEELKRFGYWIYGADMEGESYYSVKLERPIALVIGNEGKGISRLVKEHCDVIVSIPLMGKISSLNASNAAAILMYEVVRAEKLRDEGQ